MKCTCQSCSGEGVIEQTCYECDGHGKLEVCISRVDLKARRFTGEELQALEALKADALRVKEQAQRLIQINPAAADSYRRQLTETLEKINAEANQIIE